MRYRSLLGGFEECELEEYRWNMTLLVWVFIEVFLVFGFCWIEVADWGDFDGDRIFRLG